MSRLLVVVFLLASTAMAMYNSPRSLFAPDATVVKHYTGYPGSDDDSLELKAKGHQQILKALAEQIGTIIINIEINVVEDAKGIIVAAVTTTLFHPSEFRQSQYHSKQFVRDGKIVYLIVEDSVV